MKIDECPNCGDDLFEYFYEKYEHEPAGNRDGSTFKGQCPRCGENIHAEAHVDVTFVVRKELPI